MRCARVLTQCRAEGVRLPSPPQIHINSTMSRASGGGAPDWGMVDDPFDLGMNAEMEELTCQRAKYSE